MKLLTWSFYCSELFIKTNFFNTPFFHLKEFYSINFASHKPTESREMHHSLDYNKFIALEDAFQIQLGQNLPFLLPTVWKYSIAVKIKICSSVIMIKSNGPINVVLFFKHFSEHLFNLSHHLSNLPMPSSV